MLTASILSVQADPHHIEVVARAMEQLSFKRMAVCGGTLYVMSFVHHIENNFPHFFSGREKFYEPTQSTIPEVREYATRIYQVGNMLTGFSPQEVVQPAR